MAVKWIKYPEAKLSSNQPPKGLEDFPFEYEMANGAQVRVSRPFCDWLVLKGDVRISDIAEEALSAKEDPATYLNSLMLSARITLGNTVKKGTKPEDAFKQKAKIPHYATGSKRLGERKASVTFGVARKPNDAGTGYAFRLEMNPKRLKKVGLCAVENEFSALFFDNVPFDSWLGRANCSRMDIAVDVLGVNVADLICRADDGGKLRHHLSEVSREETWTCLTKPSARKPRPWIIVYDKRQERIDKGKAPKFGNIAHTRIEIRQYGTTKFRETSLAKNRLSALDLGYIPDVTNKLGMPWQSFADSAMRRGFEDALMAVALVDHTRWSNAFYSSQAKFWQPADIWQSWTAGLESQGLLEWVKRAKAAAP